jgi:hypothetical protein
MNSLKKIASSFWVKSMILVLLSSSAFSMGSDHPARVLAKRCGEFRDALQTRDLSQIESFLTVEFKTKNSDALKNPQFFEQAPRLITKLLINDKYHPRDLILLPRAQFRVSRGSDGSMICYPFKNGESENPELSTAREMRLILEEGQWKILSMKLHESW